MKRLLVVEDELALQNVLLKGLTSLGYKADGAGNGREAQDLYYENPYDLIILDLNLPFIDGIELLKEFRQDNPSLNIIILSARSDVEDKVEGLNLGANDYLAKPFNFDELVARVSGLLRREFLQHNETIILDEYALDTVNQRLLYKNEDINVSRKEYELLYLLFTNQNRCMESMEIIDRIWGYEEGTIEKLKVLVSKLRKKLPLDIIQNKWGVGYYVSKK